MCSESDQSYPFKSPLIWFRWKPQVLQIQGCRSELGFSFNTIFTNLMITFPDQKQSVVEQLFDLAFRSSYDAKLSYHLSTPTNTEVHGHRDHYQKRRQLLCTVQPPLWNQHPLPLDRSLPSALTLAKITQLKCQNSRFIRWKHWLFDLLVYTFWVTWLTSTSSVVRVTLSTVHLL